MTARAHPSFDRTIRVCMRLHRGALRWILGGVLAGAVVFGGAASAHAAPIRATGEATLAELGSKGTIEAARKRALTQARAAALKLALEQIQGPRDAAAERAVLASAEAWTGAYRVITSRTMGEAAVIEIEVEIDLPRLAKRVLPRAEVMGAPLYRVTRIEAGPPGQSDAVCEALGERLASELGALGATSERPGATAVALRLRCQVLGVVPHTWVRAVRVQVELVRGEAVLAASEGAGIGSDDDSARAEAMQRAAERLAQTLARTRPGRVSLRIEQPWPAARVRRFERALEEAVPEVRRTAIVGIEAGGAVRLEVEGAIDAPSLARGIEALSIPGFSLTIASIDDPGALTVRFGE